MLKNVKVYERRCVVCGRPESEAGLLSTRGICAEDSEMLIRENAAQMRDGSGPFYDHWVRQWSLAAKRRIVALDRGLLVDSNEGT